MESRYMKFAVLSLVSAWGILILIYIAGHLRWDNRLLWVPPALMSLSFFSAAGSWEYEERRLPLVATALLAFASLTIYATSYVFLFAFSIPAR